MSGGKITGDVFGGAKSGIVTESNMIFSGGSVVGNIYAGGEGYATNDGEMTTTQETVVNPDGSLSVVITAGTPTNNDNRLSFTGKSTMTFTNNVSVDGMVFGSAKAGMSSEEKISHTVMWASRF